MAGVRIFKEGSRVQGVGVNKIHFEGVVSSFETEWQDDYFWVKKNGFSLFRRNWEDVLDKDGNGFASKADTETYLDEVFSGGEDIKQWVLNNYGQPEYDFELDITTLLTF